jgi:hypothetical protein
MQRRFVELSPGGAFDRDAGAVGAAPAGSMRYD